MRTAGLLALVLVLASCSAAADDPDARGAELEVPAQADDEYARFVLRDGSGESFTTGATPEGQGLSLLSACVGAPDSFVTVTVLDAAAGREGHTVEERTIGTIGGIRCDGMEHRDDVLTGTGGPMQVTIDEVPEGVTGAYALLVPADA